MKSDVYKFSPQFQRQLLRLMFSDGDFLSKYVTLVEPKYFEEYAAELLCHMLFKYFEKFETVPTFMVVEQELALLKKDKSSSFTEDKIEEVTKYFSNIFKEEVKDIDYIEDKVISFAKSQALKRFVLSSAEVALKMDSEEDYNALRGKLDDVLSVGTNIQDLGVDAFHLDEIEKRIESRKEGTRKDAIAFGLEHLDKKLYGGICPGEVCALLAPSGVGKSIIMIACGKNALKRGHTVFHYTLELTEKVIMNRYDASMSKIKYHSLDKYPEKVRSRLVGKQGLLRVKWFPGGETSMLDITNHMKLMKSLYGIDPDFVIIDYGDELRSYTSKVREHWITAGQVYKEISNFAVKFNKPVLTCTQTNSGAIDKEVITVKDMGESYNKVKKLDIIIAFCQAGDEEENNKGRLFTAKVRDAESKYLTYVDFDKNKMDLTWDREMQERKKDAGKAEAKK